MLGEGGGGDVQGKNKIQALSSPRGSLSHGSVNNEERSLAIILSEPEKTSGSNDIIQKVASSLL